MLLTSQGHHGLAEAMDSELLQEHFEDEDPFDDVDGNNRYAAQEFTALTDDDDEIEPEAMEDNMISNTLNEKWNPLEFTSTKHVIRTTSPQHATCLVG